MTLTARLSAFFLAALALILFLLGGGLYSVAYVYLYDQIDDQLVTALDTLEAAVDVEPGGLEWEPHERRITLGVDPGPQQVRWRISGPDGKPVDTSANTTQFPDAWSPAMWSDEATDVTFFSNLAENNWRVAGRVLRLADLLRMGRGHEEDDLPDDDIEYPKLFLAVGMSQSPVQANLRWLGLALVAFSVALWLVCALLARSFCRRALQPLTKMAVATREMTAGDVCERLPTPGTRDELDDLGTAFNELLGRREAAFERERRFTAEASHQLRSPLAGMLSLIDVIRRRERPAAEYETALDQVRGEAVRLQRIIEALMFLARAETAGVAPVGEAVDLSGWLPTYVQQWGEERPQTTLEFRPLTAGAAWINIPQALLSELLHNLLENAAKYGPAEGPIVVELARAPQRIAISVIDRGPGVSVEDRKHLFDPFFRSAAARNRGTPGTGLGLAVAQRIAKSCGGELTLESAVGLGSRFTISLPERLPASAEPSGGNTAVPRTEVSR